LEIYSLANFRAEVWDDMLRWEYSHAKVIFDPRGEVGKAIADKTKMPESFWKKRIAACVEYLRWYCSPDEADGTMSEAWVERGDLTAAHYCLNYTLELMFELVFALNREFLPAPKWRLYYSYGLRRLPEGFKEGMMKAMKVEGFSLEEFKRRLVVLHMMWNRVMPIVEEDTNLTLAQLHTYYTKSILRQ
jgi:hypothetical protein